MLHITNVIPAKAGASADGTSIQLGGGRGCRAPWPPGCPHPSPLPRSGRGDGYCGLGVVALNFGHPLRALHASPSRGEGVLCTTLPLDAQGGIKGGLDSVFRFALHSPAHLDSGFRRNDGSCAQHPKGELIPVDADDAATYVAETIDCGIGVDGIGNAVGLGSVGELV